jgi:hypothetical protein
VPGPEGLHIAHAWLAEMIIHLSRQIEASRIPRKGSSQVTLTCGVHDLHAAFKYVCVMHTLILQHLLS